MPEDAAAGRKQQTFKELPEYLMLLNQVRPAYQYQDGADKGGNRRERKIKAPPVYRTGQKENERKNSTCFITAPEEPDGVSFGNTDDEKPDEKRDRCGDTVAFETSAPVSGIAEHIRNAESCGKIPDSHDAGNTQTEG